MKRIYCITCLLGLFRCTGHCRRPSRNQNKQTEADEIAKQHDNTLRALRDGLPLILPCWSLPVYFGMHMDEKDKKPEKTATKKK